MSYVIHKLLKLLHPQNSKGGEVVIRTLKKDGFMHVVKKTSSSHVPKHTQVLKTR